MGQRHPELPNLNTVSGKSGQPIGRPMTEIDPHSPLAHLARLRFGPSFGRGLVSVQQAINEGA